MPWLLVLETEERSGALSKRSVAERGPFAAANMCLNACVLSRSVGYSHTPAQYGGQELREKARRRRGDLAAAVSEIDISCTPMGPAKERNLVDW